MEHQRLAPLGPMTHPLVPYLKGMSHMALILCFWIETRDKGHENHKKKFGKILRKRQGKIEWQKLKEGWWDF